MSGILWLSAYGLVLLAIGLFAWKKSSSRSLDTLLLHERSAGTFTIGWSFAAVVFGASSVFGLAGWAYRIGWPAVGWTFSGVVFLIILAFAFAKTARESKSVTISDLIAGHFGTSIRFFVSLILWAAWLVILAGQIIAGGAIIDLILHNTILSYIVFTAMFTAYTLLSGQSAAMKSGWFQTLLMTAGIVGLLILTLTRKPDAVTVVRSAPALQHLSPVELIGIFLPVGLTYLFGPDMFSRVFAAKDTKSARNGVLLGAGIIALITLPIVGLGIAARPVLGQIANPDRLIPSLVTAYASGPMGSLFLVMLVSIPLSGADVMLVSLSALLGRDILSPVYSSAKKQPSEKSMKWIVRASMLLSAALAVFISLRLKAIIPSLLVSYKVFTAGIAPLLFAALLARMTGLKPVKASLSIGAGIYLALSALAVFALEFHFLPIRLPFYHLWLLGFNTLVTLCLFWLIPWITAKKKG